MVKLVEIEDESIYDGDSQYTTDDDISSVGSEIDEKNEDSQDEYDSDFDEEDDDDYLDESLLERIAALKDIIPSEHRRSISNTIQSVGSWGAFGLSLVGKLGWVFTTSALLVVFPLAIESDREKMMQQWEAEQQGAAQGAGPAGQLPGGPPPPPGMMAQGAPGMAPGLVA
ncbi:mitochondrial import receptor subunit Tom22 [Coemansia sp. Benny D115]|nr:mitochondrial import receptor subunit Tom22 [Coemansia sp. Benny D115]